MVHEMKNSWWSPGIQPALGSIPADGLGLFSLFQLKKEKGVAIVWLGYVDSRIHSGLIF